MPRFSLAFQRLQASLNDLSHGLGKPAHGGQPDHIPAVNGAGAA